MGIENLCEGNTDDVAVKVKTPNVVRNKRNYFVQGGSMHEIRLKRRKANLDHIAVKIGSKNTRCIICCFNCIKNKDHNKRMGYATMNTCTSCSKSLYIQMNPSTPND